ncbi:hypothetical protein CF336_g7611 [Tilletia laevis]|nr:hypothetical protein CF336_g7611 [Tilletia laevis]
MAAFRRGPAKSMNADGRVPRFSLPLGGTLFTPTQSAATPLHAQPPSSRLFSFAFSPSNNSSPAPPTSSSSSTALRLFSGAASSSTAAPLALAPPPRAPLPASTSSRRVRHTKPVTGGRVAVYRARVAAAGSLAPSVSRRGRRLLAPAPPLSVAAADEVACAYILLHLRPHPSHACPLSQSMPPQQWWELQVGMASSIMTSTMEGYGSSVRAFLKWCEQNNIPTPYRFPTHTGVLLCFYRANLDQFRASTQRNRHAAIRLWHELHGFELAVSEFALARLSRAGTLLQPEPLPSRRPVRLDNLQVIRNGLEIHNDRAHAAIWACVSFAFFSLARIGEVTADLSAPRDPTARALRYHWSLRPPDGIIAATVTLRLPVDKTQGPTGSELIASSQAASSPQICPVHAVHHHLLVNAAVPADAGPFAYIDCNGHPRELTGSFCTDTANAILAAANRPPIKGHCLRIGGTTFYMSAGIPETDIRRHGRWKTDVMLTYIRRMYVSAGRTFANVDPTFG